jgi:uncharacterized spore protein YtfJ
MQEIGVKKVGNSSFSSAESFLGSLAENLSMSIHASRIFADPVERNGVTVIPVAKARWAFGGGGGRRKEEDGGGGGGGAKVTPVGFIELKDGEARFQRIETISLPTVVLSAAAGFLLMQRLTRRRASKNCDDQPF